MNVKGRYRRSEMPKFVSRPNEIEARRVREKEMKITTRDGNVITGQRGDWLITGHEGRLCFYSDKVFRTCYQPTDAVSQDEWLFD